MKKTVLTVAIMVSLLVAAKVAQSEIYTFTVKNTNTAVYGYCDRFSVRVAIGTGEVGNFDFVDFSSNNTLSPNGGEVTLNTSNLSKCDHINLSIKCWTGLDPFISISPCASGKYNIVADHFVLMR